MDLDLDFDLDLDRPDAMNFRELEVYQFAVRLLPLAAQVADVLPQRHASLADQLRRASLSIPLDIAEGSGESTGADPRRISAMARGPAMECAAIVDACLALNLIAQAPAKEADGLLLSLDRLLSKMCLSGPVQVQVRARPEDTSP